MKISIEDMNKAIESSEREELISFIQRAGLEVYERKGRIATTSEKKLEEKSALTSLEEMFSDFKSRKRKESEETRALFG